MPRRRARRAATRNLVPLVDRLVEQRYGQAAQSAAALRAELPSASTDELADALIRRCARELALGGAVTGGAAASPVAGMTVAAATAGADATWSVGRLSELIMGLGVLYGHEHATVEERAGWVWAVLGISEGAAVGLTGLAARIGSRGGARLLARLPDASRATVNASLSRRVLSRAAGTKGPWSLAALVPYGIGAGVGAAGNLVLAQSVGRAAKQFFANQPPPEHLTVPLVEDAGIGEVVDDGWPHATVVDGEVFDAEIVDAEVAEVVEVVVEDDVIDAEVVE